MHTESHGSLLPTDWKIPAAIRVRLGDEPGRQRVMEEEGHLLLVLHAPPGADEQGRRGRFFWRDTEGKWHAAPRTDRIASIEAHLDDYHGALTELEQLEEAAAESHEYFDLLDHAAPLVRSTRNLHDTLEVARQAAPADRRLIVARDRAYELARRAELLQTDAKNGLDFAIAWQAEQQADSARRMAVAAYRLNLLVAFFFPIATLTAIFGTNLGHGLEQWDQLQSPLPLLAVIAAGLFGGLMLTLYVTLPSERPQQDRRRSTKRR